MVTPELLGYIQTSIAAGKTREQIERELETSGGWRAADVAEAFGALHIIPQIKSTTTVTSAAPKHSTGARIFHTLVALIIIACLAFAAEKFYGTEINAAIARLLGTQQSPATSITTQSDGLTNIQPPTSSIVSLQTPAAALPELSTPEDTAPTTDQSVTTTCPDDDLNCLALAAGTCTVASVKNTVTIHLLGMATDTTTVFGITGKQGSGCAMSFENLANHNQGTCVFKKTSDITTLLKNWEKNSFSTTDLSKATCTGAYFQ